MSSNYGRPVCMWFAAVAFFLSLCTFFVDGTAAEEGKDGCEVVSFEAFEESQAVLTPAGDYKVISKRQCANLILRNTSGKPRPAGDFMVDAVFGDGNIAEAEPASTGPDPNDRTWPGEPYRGTVCFDEDFPILIMNCSFK